MLHTVFGNPWVRASGLLLLLIVIAGLAYMLSQVLVPLFLAFMVAYAFDPVMDYFERKRIPRTIAVVGLVVVLTSTVLLIPLYFVPKMVSEAQDLIDSAARDVDDAWLNRMLERLPLESFVDLMPPIEEQKLFISRELDFEEELDADTDADYEAILEPLSYTDEISEEALDDEARVALEGRTAEVDLDEVDMRAVLAQRIGYYIQQNATQFLRAHASALMGVSRQAGSSVADLFSSLGNFIMNFIVIVGNFALFAFVAIYLLKDYDTIIRNMDDLLPKRYKPKIRSIMGKIDNQLRGFLRGQLLVCLFLGISYTIGMELSGTPFGLFLGVFGGLASMVPYLGFALTIGPAVLLTLIEHGFSLNVVGVLLTFGIAQSVESYFVTPKVVGSQVGLGPVWIILSFVVFSTTLGFIGLLLAVPIAAVLKVLVLETVEYYTKSEFFRKPPGEDPTPS